MWPPSSLAAVGSASCRSPRESATVSAASRPVVSAMTVRAKPCFAESSPRSSRTNSLSESACTRVHVSQNVVGCLFHSARPPARESCLGLILSHHPLITAAAVFTVELWLIEAYLLQSRRVGDL